MLWAVVIITMSCWQYLPDKNDPRRCMGDEAVWPSEGATSFWETEKECLVASHFTPGSRCVFNWPFVKRDWAPLPQPHPMTKDTG